MKETLKKQPIEILKAIACRLDCYPNPDTDVLIESIIYELDMNPEHDVDDLIIETIGCALHDAITDTFGYVSEVEKLDSGNWVAEVEAGSILNTDIESFNDSDHPFEIVIIEAVEMNLFHITFKI